MIVVSNASPLIALVLIEHVHLLPALYNQIHIAPAVHREVIGGVGDRQGAAMLASAEWLIASNLPAEALNGIGVPPVGLHTGEIETVALPLQLRADLVLVDEQRARRFAQSKGLKVLGTLGVLKLAHQSGLLADLRTALDALRGQGFRFSDSLYREILEST